jgi:predicted NBD/HSP70 family sugar kinase
MKMPLQPESSSLRTIGIDIGGTHIRSIISDGLNIGQVNIEKTPNTYDVLLSTLRRIIESGKSSGELSSVGLGLPGRTDPEKPIWIPKLPFLNQSPLMIDLEKLTHLPTTLINDAQAALVGEVNFGAAKGCRNVVLVTLGTGIGGGVMIDGKIYLGHNGTAGSFGWLLAPVRVFPNPEHGPWERWASGNSLLNASRDLGLSVSELIEQANESPESQAGGVLTDFASRIGKGLGSLASIFDPQIVVVSGGLVNSWSLLRNGVQDGFNSTASPSVRNTPIKVAILGSDAGAVGASVTSRNYFNTNH